MAFDRPTLAAIADRVKTDIETRLVGAQPRIARTPEAYIGKALAGASHLLHGHLQWLADQIIPDRATGDALLRWCAVVGLAKTPAAAASGTATATGTNGTTIPAGTSWERADGASYTQDSDATISGGQATITLTADEKGADGNCEPGVTLTVVGTIAGLDPDAVVDGSGIGGGADEETDDALRARLSEFLSDPPRGGAAADYTRWALEVAGTTRVWVFANWLEYGRVGLAFVRDADAVTIVPDGAERQQMYDYIAERMPVGVDLQIIELTEAADDYTISVSPDTAAVRAAVQAQLEDMYRRDAEPGATVLLSRVREAIALAEDEEDHTVTSPTADVAHDTDELPVLGTITWV